MEAANYLSKQESIFERIPDSGKLQVKETVHIHLYSNIAPCGDAVCLFNGYVF